MAKGGPEVGNTVPIFDPNTGAITGYTTPEFMAGINAAVSDAGVEKSPIQLAAETVFYSPDTKTDTATVPVYDNSVGGGGEVINYVTPEQAEQISAANKVNSETGMFDSGFRVGTTPADSEWGAGTGISINGEVATGDFDWVNKEGRATYNPGWSFGADGKMYWVGDGPRPSDAEARAWAEAHKNNAGKGIVPGQEGNLSLGTPYPKDLGGDYVYKKPLTGAPDIELPPTGGPTPPQPPTEKPIQPIVNEPTDDWFMPDEWLDYTNAPQPDGDGSFDDWHGKNKQSDTSWNWDAYRDRAPGDRQFGGYDEDYQAFERYIPGMDSPWGLPNVKGGNEDFYQQQFLNQLRDEQGYRSRQKAAQKRANQAALNPYEAVAAEDVWSWANNGEGLREVQMGGGAPEVQWELNNAFTPGESTIGEILDWGSTQEGFGDGRQFYKTIKDGMTQKGRDSTAWSSAGDPSKLRDTLMNWGGLSPQQTQMMSDLVSGIYNQGQAGPYAPSGYASPVNQPVGGA